MRDLQVAERGWCTSCVAGFHTACTGWWDWCTCECALGGPNDPLRRPEHLNGHKGEP